MRYSENCEIYYIKHEYLTLNQTFNNICESIKRFCFKLFQVYQRAAEIVNVINLVSFLSKCRCALLQKFSFIQDFFAKTLQGLSDYEL